MLVYIKVDSVDTYNSPIDEDVSAIKFGFSVYLNKFDRRTYRKKDKDPLFSFVMYYSTNIRYLWRLKEICKIIYPRKKIIENNVIKFSIFVNRFFWANIDTEEIKTIDNKIERRLIIRGKSKRWLQIQN